MRPFQVLLLVGLLEPMVLCKRVISEFGSTQIASNEQFSKKELTHTKDDQYDQDQDEDDEENENEEEGEDEESEEDDQDDETKESNQTKGGGVGLIVVDIQNCFTESGVGLGNPRGDWKYKSRVRKFVNQVRKAGAPIVLLQDYHPKEHISFGNVAMQDPNWKWDPVAGQTLTTPLCKSAVEFDNTPFYRSDKLDRSTLDLDPDKYLPMKGKCEKHDQEVTQPLFPAHCVQKTEEVTLINKLCKVAGGKEDDDTCEPKRKSRLKVVRKGMNPGIDSFGGVWDNRAVAGIHSNRTEKGHWGLLQFFKKHKVKHVIHIGIADDFCVKTTALAVMSKTGKSFGIKSASVVPPLTYGIFRQLADRQAVDKKKDPHGVFGDAPKDDGLRSEYTDGGVEIDETVDDALKRLNR